MYTRDKLSSIIEEYVRGLDFPSEPEPLYEPIIYSLESGGKRIRPLLAMISCNIFSEDPMPALASAAAVEIFHNFTLLHDDIMDNAAVRRGRASVHRRWGSNAAILSGDAMMIYAYKVLQRSPQEYLPRLLDVFTTTSLQVCEGQQYDMDFEVLENVSTEEYLKMISLKTAVLMAGSALLGAICGGAGEEDCELIYRFGMDLGMAFQIMDDILDSYGSEEILGKKIGGDILEGKKTFLMISALQAADDRKRMRLSGVLHNESLIPGEKITEVLGIYDSLGIRAKAEEAVEFYTARAIESLEALSVPSGRIEMLKDLAYELTKRIS